jgi:hypothetical protein
MIVSLLSQLDSQQWKAKHVVFAGMVQITPTLSLTKPEVMPAYMIIGEKCFKDGEKFAPPVIKGGNNALSN